MVLGRLSMWVRCLSLNIAFLAGCGHTDDVTSATPAPSPEVRILSVQPVGGTAMVGECLEMGRDMGGTVIVAVDPSPLVYSLKPPGLCSVDAACGYLAVALDPESEGSPTLARSATVTVDVPLADQSLGQHVLLVELRRENDQVAVTPSGRLAQTEMEISLSAPGGCAVPDDSRSLPDATEAASSTPDGGSLTADAESALEQDAAAATPDSGPE